LLLGCALGAAPLVAAVACGGAYSEEAAPSPEPGPDATGGGPDANFTPTNDGGAGDAATDTSPEASTRFCGNVGTQQGTNIFCADFDGTDLREGFTGSADAGLSTTNTTALSAPLALLASGPSGTTFGDRGPALWWENLGAPISILDVTVGVNQPISAGLGGGGTGTVDLMKMKTETTTTTFLFSRANPNWLVEIEYVGAAAYGKRDEVTIPLVAGKWTKVNLSYNFRTGTVTVSYDGVTVFNKPAHYTPAPTLLDSKATISLGAVTSGQTSSEPFRYDNLIARVTRE